ncbi:conserved hypothetical protein [Gloeothece citriformis PCC 7424]|uniref:DUF3445 domain-containing protein n=1 Tax=Gloeothece citriformis (strain PCC 7424) TaxID=65393 RepID=B7KKA5_GLOC7|nr:DUF3445 domain-containing protein [Gloeothece citriformis]ACK70990.1 conserved hypothetical protein [Gloeothece citriformis PCC 7424]
MNQTKYLPKQIIQGKWKMTAGLAPLNLSEWIDIDENFISTVTLKAQLLKDKTTEVFTALPNTIEAQQEILELLLDHLLTYFPQYYLQQGTILKNLQTNQVFELNYYKDAPLTLALHLVAEDIFLLQPSEKGYILTAGVACFPFFWRLQDKIGLPIEQIHQPVPEYAGKLSKTVNLYFDHLLSTSPGYRIAWGIVPTPQLVLEQMQPPGWENTLTPSNIGERLWLRSEYQTFRRLPHSGGIVFTIRTFVNPLSTLKSMPSMAHNLATVIREMPPETQAYKKIQPFLNPLLNYLDSHPLGLI